MCALQYLNRVFIHVKSIICGERRLIEPLASRIVRLIQNIESTVIKIYVTAFVFIISHFVFKMENSNKMGLESLYHDTNRNISGTHAALAQLNNRVSYGGETSEQNQSLNARKIEGSINTIMR